jgi:prophage regulatory protein
MFDAMKRAPASTNVEPTVHAPLETALRFLSVKEVVRRTSLSRATVYRLVQAGTFPHPVTLTGARSAWVETEITAWMQSRLARRDQGASVGTAR